MSALTQLNLDRHNRVSTSDCRLIRRVVRDAATRGYNATQTLQRWDMVTRGEKQHIFPFQERCDAMFNSALAYWLNRAVGEKHNIACPSALIGASNFFELAVAAAISLFGFQSGAALATVVGVLIEVPVMLLVVKVVNASKAWYERPLQPQ